MHPKLKVCIVLFSLILFIPIRINVQACSYSPEGEELRYMLFNPDLLNNKSWWSFFYTSKLTYLDGQVSSANDEDVLTKEWMKEIGVDVSHEETFDCIFGSHADSVLQSNSFYQAIRESDHDRDRSVGGRPTTGGEGCSVQKKQSRSSKCIE
jgi:hypothetical protein